MHAWVTEAADVAAPLTWTCSDADLNRHTRLVLEQICSDKTRTAGAVGHGAETFVFTRESTTAFMHMEQTGPSAGTVRPVTTAEAANRLRLMRERFEHIKQGLAVSMEREWGDGPDAGIQDADEHAYFSAPRRTSDTTAGWRPRSGFNIAVLSMAEAWSSTAGAGLESAYRQEAGAECR